MRAIAIVAGLASNVLAQSANTEAEALLEKAKKLLADGKTAEACRTFEASQKLAPLPATQNELANCREKNKQLATAWRLFVAVERQLRDKSDEPSEKLRSDAKARAAALEPRLSKLMVRVEEPVSNQDVLRNGDLVDRSQWNKAVPIDGGRYRFDSSAPGKGQWGEIIEIAFEKGDQTLVIPRLRPVMPSAAH